MFQSHTTPFSWLLIIEPEIFEDIRGSVMESYSQRKFLELGIDCCFVQDNHSISHKWVIRGLHVQTQHSQAKLLRVVSGSIYDVVVDLRKDSPTFGKWYGILLSAKNKKQLFIPAWFAHGFLSLEDETQVLYKCDDFYYPEYDVGIAFDDPLLAIDWGKYCPKEDFILSEKARNSISFSDFCKNNPF